MNGISFFDILVIVILCVFTIRGGLRGMMSQVVSLLSIGIAWFVAARQSALVAPHISVQEPWNRVAAMLLLFVGTWLGVWVLYRFVASAFKTMKLKDFDRQMGALLGFVKGLLLCLLITFFAVSMNWSRDAVYQSKSGYYLTHILNQTQAVIPNDIWANIQEKLQKYGFTYREPTADYGGEDQEAESGLQAAAQKLKEGIKMAQDVGQTINAINAISSSLPLSASATEVPMPPATPVPIFNPPDNAFSNTANVTQPDAAPRPSRAAVPFGGSSTSEAGGVPRQTIGSHRAWSQAIRDSEQR